MIKWEWARKGKATKASYNTNPYIKGFVILIEEFYLKLSSYVEINPVRALLFNILTIITIKL